MAVTLNAWSTDVGHQISRAIATLLGIPEPANAWLAFAVQARRETAGGTIMAAANNPLNLRPIDAAQGGPWPGQIGVAPGPFSIFGALEAGCWAAAENYTAPPYAGVIDAFKAGDPIALAQAIENSPWDADHYGDPPHTHTDLDDEVRAELAMEDDMFTDDDRAKLQRIYDHLEAYEPMTWVARLQQWLAKAFRSLPVLQNADLTGPDVTTGEPFK